MLVRVNTCQNAHCWKSHAVAHYKGKVGQTAKFGHTFANSVNPDETAPYKPSRQDFHCLLI